MEESLTLINLNRVKIVENRQTINEIIGSLAEMDNRLTTLQQVEKDIYKIETFLSVYFQIDVAMEELKQAIHAENDCLHSTATITVELIVCVRSPRRDSESSYWTLKITWPQIAGFLVIPVRTYGDLTKY